MDYNGDIFFFAVLLNIVSSVFFHKCSNILTRTQCITVNKKSKSNNDCIDPAVVVCHKHKAQTEEASRFSIKQLALTANPAGKWTHLCNHSRIHGFGAERFQRGGSVLCPCTPPFEREHYCNIEGRLL